MNPELQRNLWLEFSPQRLIMMPLVQALFFGVLIAQDVAEDELGYTAFWMIVVLIGLWGTRAAGEAVVGEVADGTWDQQRLSSLGPWTMTWGKLLGSTSYVWYGCAPALGVFVIAAFDRLGPALALLYGALLVVALLFAFAVSLLVSLYSALRGLTPGRRTSFVLQLAGVAVFAPWAYLIGLGYSGTLDAATVTWFGLSMPSLVMITISLACFAIWAVVACYRLMREELRLTNLPWAWIGFVLFAVMFAVGWRWQEPGQLVRAVAEPSRHLLEILESGSIALMVTLVAGYMALLVEPKDPVDLRRLKTHFASGRVVEALTLVPLWFSALVLALPPVLFNLALALIGGVVTQGVAVLSLLAFFLRDAALFVFFNLAERRERADAAAMFYLVLLYALLPVLTGSIAGVAVDGWFYPSLQASSYFELFPVLFQVALVWGLTYYRWQRRWSTSPSAPPQT